MPNNSNLGKSDAFIAKYDAIGNQLWVQQFGSSNYYEEDVAGIITDINGNVYVTGKTFGNFPGTSFAGGYTDAFIAGFDSNSNLLNTANTSSTLSINDITLAEGNNGTKNATFTVTLSHPVNSIVSVNYATADNTATAGNDYLATSGTLTFNSNETTKQIVFMGKATAILSAFWKNLT